MRDCRTVKMIGRLRRQNFVKYLNDELWLVVVDGTMDKKLEEGPTYHCIQAGPLAGFLVGHGALAD